MVSRLSKTNNHQVAIFLSLSQHFCDLFATGFVFEQHLADASGSIVCHENRGKIQATPLVCFAKNASAPLLEHKNTRPYPLCGK